MLNVNVFSVKAEFSCKGSEKLSEWMLFRRKNSLFVYFSCILSDEVLPAAVMFLHLGLAHLDEVAVGSTEGVGGVHLHLHVFWRDVEDALEHAAEEAVSSADTAAGSAGNADVSDAVQALVALGYSNSEALRAVKKVKIQEGMDTQEILKNALRFIGL